MRWVGTGCYALTCLCFACFNASLQRCYLQYNKHYCDGRETVFQLRGPGKPLASPGDVPLGASQRAVSTSNHQRIEEVVMITSLLAAALHEAHPDDVTGWVRRPVSVLREQGALLCARMVIYQYAWNVRSYREDWGAWPRRISWGNDGASPTRLNGVYDDGPGPSS